MLRGSSPAGKTRPRSSRPPVDAGRCEEGRTSPGHGDLGGRASPSWKAAEPAPGSHPRSVGIGASLSPSGLAPQNPRGCRLGHIPHFPLEALRIGFPLCRLSPRSLSSPRRGSCLPLPWEGPGHPCTPGPGVGQVKGAGELPCPVCVHSCKAPGPAWGLGQHRASDDGPRIPTPARLPAPPPG